jgi:hypothetical protein
MGTKAGAVEVGTLSNVSTAGFTSLGIVDVRDASFQEMWLDVLITYGGNPGASKTFTLYWSWDSHGFTAAQGVAAVGGRGSDGVNWQSMPVSLHENANAADPQSLPSVIFSKNGLTLHVAYKCDTLTTALTSVVVELGNNPGGAQ